MLVELKTGETLNGHLVNCDTYMNLTLKEVVQTSPEGEKFFRLPECYVRGNNVRETYEEKNCDWKILTRDRLNTSVFQTRWWRRSRSSRRVSRHSVVEEAVEVAVDEAIITAEETGEDAEGEVEVAEEEDAVDEERHTGSTNENKDTLQRWKSRGNAAMKKPRLPLGICGLDREADRSWSRRGARRKTHTPPNGWLAIMSTPALRRPRIP